ncbi:MAG TPA: hypothetical protein VKE72_02910 [Methylocella sp.]|jgi:hypothetical protein|nr:hypothetical protein [Methylocella sp.]
MRPKKSALADPLHAGRLVIAQAHKGRATGSRFGLVGRIEPNALRE